MGVYTLYRAYYKQRRPSGSTQSWQTVLPMEISYTDGSGHTTVIEENSTHCGYVPPVEPQYRWVNIPINQDYQCDTTTYTKYYKQKRQVSMDNGATWNDVSPAEYQRGGVYETNSIDCGYVEPPLTGYAAEYLTFVANQDCRFYYTTRYPTSQLWYSIDGGDNWVQLSSSYETYENPTYTPTIPAGSEIKWKGNLTSGIDYHNIIYGVANFASEGRFRVYGNPMSLSKGDDFRVRYPLRDYQFVQLFNGCTGLTSAGDLALYHTETNGHCYEAMFAGCTELAVAPQLPATKMVSCCYRNMFAGCTSLMTAPQLHGIRLDQYCYQGMFKGCTSLIRLPELPLTTLASGCYRDMFANCTSITTAPQLPATTMKGECYLGMFAGCTGLTTAPQLPATTLEHYCYHSMFAGCTSLTTAPELSATTLADFCYCRMFSGCTSLMTAPQLTATTLAGGCYENMFSNCTSLTTAPVLSATTLADYCYDGMFSGCTNLTTAPQLPATTLTRGCYSSMFADCTSLTTAPTLPATTLARECYYFMFASCTNLISVTCLATDRSASWCTGSWLYRVASTGTFTKAASMSSWPTGKDGIPSGWTVVDYA